MEEALIDIKTLLESKMLEYNEIEMNLTVEKADAGFLFIDLKKVAVYESTFSWDNIPLKIRFATPEMIVWGNQVEPEIKGIVKAGIRRRKIKIINSL
jgi:hypothetical protein